MAETIFDGIWLEDLPQAPALEFLIHRTGTLTIDADRVRFQARQRDVELGPISLVRFHSTGQRAFPMHSYRWLVVQHGAGEPKTVYLADPDEVNHREGTSGATRMFLGLYALAPFDPYVWGLDWTPEERVTIGALEVAKGADPPGEPRELLRGSSRIDLPAGPVARWSRCPDCGGTLIGLEGASECAGCRRIWCDPGRTPSVDDSGRLMGTVSDGKTGLRRWIAGERVIEYLRMPKLTPPPLPTAQR